MSTTTTKKSTFRSPTEFVRAADAPPIAAAPPPETNPSNPPAKLPRVRLSADKARPGPAAQAPWSTANPRVIKHFGLRMPETLHAKLTWVQEHTPNETMHSLALAAVEADVEQRLADLQKPVRG